MRYNCRYKLLKRNGVTLVELIAAMAIAAIVGTMVVTMFILPQRVLSAGEKRSDVQFNLRMISDVITDEIRLSTGIVILPATETIPNPIENDDKYIYASNTDGALIVCDNKGTHKIFALDSLDIVFSVSAPYRALTYVLTGSREKESFSLNSQVNALNLPDSSVVIDNSGTADGKIIKIENNLSSSNPTSLYFILETPHQGTVNEFFFRTFSASNYSGLCSYTFVNGELPPGISLNGTAGTLYGTPTTAGNYFFSIKLSDSIKSVTRAFIVNIIPGSSDPLPEAQNIQVSGTFKANAILSGQYTYYDPNGIAEGESLASWYRMDDSIGTNKVLVKSSEIVTQLSTIGYTVSSADEGKYISLEITPKSYDGRIGVITKSSPQLVAENAEPEAQNPDIVDAFGLHISNKVTVGDVLYGDYEYYDNDNDPQGATKFQWYRLKVSDIGKENPSSIPGATNISYVTTNSDKNCVISFSVTPVATSGKLMGTTVVSANVEVKN